MPDFGRSSALPPTRKILPPRNTSSGKPAPSPVPPSSIPLASPLAASGFLNAMPSLLGDSAPAQPPTAVSEDLAARIAEVLAHRLRGPLAAVQAYAEILMETAATADQRDCTLRIFEAAASAEALLADLQRFAVPPEPVLRPTGLAGLLTETVALLDLEVPLLVPDALAVLADPVLLRQIVLALLTNAHEAGGALAVTAHADAEAVAVEVASRGAVEAAESAFEPFHTTKAQHLGLGLPMARRLAEAMGGALNLAESGPDRTVFRLSLRKADSV